MDGIAPNGMAPVAIGWRDLSAWCDLTGNVLEPWEARLIVRLSSVRAQIAGENDGKPDGNSNDG